MQHWFLVPAAGMIAALSFVPAPAPAQTLVAAEKKPAAAKAPSGDSWTKRTPDGQPDIQGIWSNATITPFERPVALGNKPILTEEEAAEAEKRAAAAIALTILQPGRGR